MERLTDKKTAEDLRSNAEGLQLKGFEVPIDDLRYIKLARYEDEEENKLAEMQRQIDEIKMKLDNSFPTYEIHVEHFW